MAESPAGDGELMPAKPLKTSSGTDTLMAAMETFGESEPKFAIVIFVNEKDELHWLRSDNSCTTTIGVLEAIKAQVIKDWLEDE
jgi:hypothetical protein